MLLCALARDCKWRAKKKPRQANSLCLWLLMLQKSCHWRSSAKRGIPVFFNEKCSAQRRLRGETVCFGASVFGATATVAPVSVIYLDRKPCSLCHYFCVNLSYAHSLVDREYRGQTTESKAAVGKVKALD